MKTAWSVALVGLIGLALFQMVLPLVRAPFTMEIDPDEGWNAFFGEKALAGLSLYRQPTPWLSVNYPPLSFYAAGGLGRLLGDTLLAGRLISIASLLALCLTVFVIVARLTRDRYASLFAGFLCLGSFAVFGTYYVGKNDPELPAHLLSFAAFGFFLLDDRILEKPKKLFLVACLSLAGIFFKPSVVAVPLAISLDILFRSRRKFLLWAGLGSLAAAGFALPSLLLWGRGLFVQVLNFPRGYSLAKLGADALLFGLVFGLPLGALCPWLRRRLVADRIRAAGLFLGTAAVTALAFSGGHGTDVNMFFDVLIAFSLLAGLFLSELGRSDANGSCRRRGAAALAPLALMAGLLVVSVLKVPAMDSQSEVRFGVWRPGALQTLRLSRQETLADAAFIRSVEGPVICERMLLCVLSGKELVFDPFYVRESIEKGTLGEADLIRRIEAGDFGLIQLEAEIGRVSGAIGLFGFARNEAWYDRWTDGLKRAIAGHYRIARRSVNGVFYVPSRN